MSAYRVCGCALALLAAAGCRGGARHDRPETVPVRGTVRLSGNPVEGALVTFQRADGARTSVGRTDGRGRYSLTTFVPDDGAEPGEYQVQIVKYEQLDPDDAPPEAYELEQQGRRAPETRPMNLLPPRYASGATSGLTAVVEKGGANRFDFDLTPGEPSPP